MQHSVDVISKVTVSTKGGPPLAFYVRDGSSDIKALKEVVEKNSYRRKTFELASSPKWVDMGANIGAFAVLAGSLGLKVTAYEPDPQNFQLLCKNVELNKLGSLVECKEQAVSVKAGTAKFFVNSARKNYWRNSLLKPWRGGYALEVQTVDFRKVLPTAADVAWKMDIEGAEMELLEACKKFPSRLVFEWSFDIDRSIPRFVSVAEKLRAAYGNVAYAKFDETEPVWRGEWFPPCRTIWCY